MSATVKLGYPPCSLMSIHNKVTRSLTARTAMPQDKQQLSEEVSPLMNVSKRQLMAFGCACCLSLQTQQQLPAAADSGQFSYDGAGGPTHWPGVCASGLQQSPINLTLSSNACDSRPPPVVRCVVVVDAHNLWGLQDVTQMLPTCGTRLYSSTSTICLSLQA